MENIHGLQLAISDIRHYGTGYLITNTVTHCCGSLYGCCLPKYTHSAIT